MTAYSYATVRRHEIAALMFLLCAVCALFAQTYSAFNRLAKWNLDAVCISSKFEDIGISGVPTRTGWDVLTDISVRFQNLSTTTGDGFIKADTFSTTILGTLGGSVGDGAISLNVPSKTLTVVAEGSVVFAEYRGFDNITHRVQIGNLRTTDGAFVPSGPGGSCVTIEGVEYLPASPDSPNVPTIQRDPTTRPGYRAVPITITIPIQYAVWTTIDSPVHFYYGSVTVTYYAIVPDEEEQNVE